MKNPVYTVAALALIVGSGLVHGAWTNRWRTAPALAELAARLESVPTVLGDWTATSRAIPPRELAMAGAVGQISRVYTNLSPPPSPSFLPPLFSFILLQLFLCKPLTLHFPILSASCDSAWRCMISAFFLFAPHSR